MKKVLIIMLFIIAIGLIGRIDMQDEMKASKIDAENKQQAIIQIRDKCFTGELKDETLCKGF